MDKEIIEKFDKDQLDILLNDLQDIDKFTGFKNGAFKYELGKYQASLLVNYIKKQKEVIDKIYELINQQKEFIKYLEDKINFYKINTQGYSMNLVEEILQKYKSIIGVSNETN